MVHLVFFFVAPVVGAALGTLSVIELRGKSWHRPNLITRSLGGVGLLVTGWIGLQWLVIAAFYALWVALWVASALVLFFGPDMNGYFIH